MREMDECSDKRSCWGPDRHTHSRWMTLIWEITECTLTPGPRLRRATITPDRRIGQPPTNHTAHTVRTGGGGGHARAHLHTHARTHNHLTEQIVAPVLPSCLLTLKFTWSLVSQGCARKGREKKGKGAGGDKGGKSISL